MGIPACERPTRALVDLDCIAGNLRAIRGHAGVPVMAIVKANAYGHGLVPVARHLQAQGVEHLGVAFPEEGIALREAGITVPILVLGGVFAPQVARGRWSRRRWRRAGFAWPASSRTSPAPTSPIHR